MQTASDRVLDPERPSSWAEVPFELLFSLPKDAVEDAQLRALAHRFDVLCPQLTALQALASGQGIKQIEAFDDVGPILFDHRVYKSYPVSLIEQRKFDRLTTWLQRLTTHDLSGVETDGVDSVDAWLDRLGDATPLSVGHTTGTSGKLSFLPRSVTEFPGFSNARMEFLRAITGVDFRTEKIPFFTPGHRRTHYWLGAKLGRMRAGAEVGPEGPYMPFDYELTADLLSMAARLQAADEQGELDTLQIDPRLLEERAQLIERGRRRDEDVHRWLIKLADEFRDRRVTVSGSTADLVRVAVEGRELGITCQFAADSLLIFGGGMKTYKDAPAEWETLLQEFFAIDQLASYYTMAECLSSAPRCDKGYFHFFPYTLPVLLDEDFAPLPREGVQTGRMALFDFLAETFWGGFISGDQVTMHWDYDCECGWTGPRIADGSVFRFADLAGVQDDKAACAGIEHAYSEFMEYIATI